MWGSLRLAPISKKINKNISDACYLNVKSGECIALNHVCMHVRVYVYMDSTDVRMNANERACTVYT